MTIWTGEQLEAIERRDGDLLLDAGAGSGKTSVLVERFVRAVLEDGIDVSAILTITFTEKAAAELRDRIRARLRDLGAVEAARATEGAFISTIHGFCARVLRSHALAAGLDPQFAVLDRYQSEPLAAGAFDDALDELARSDDRAVDLIAAYGPGPLRAAIIATYGQLRSIGETRPSLPEVPEPALADVAAELAAAAASARRELGKVMSPGVKVLDAIERVGRCAELAPADQLWPTELDALKLPGGNGAALSTEVCVTYSEALARLREALAAAAAKPVRDLLEALLHAYGERYTEAKREHSGLDFEDLELITRDLLGTIPELRERYRARFERIMVDELQDTNRVQLELIESIARGNLFTVGDAQQSIYGFRHAEVELFERRGELLAASGARETLRTNFRSRRGILDVLNLAFAGELGNRFKPLLAGRSEPPDAEPADGEPRVELQVVDKGADWNSEGVASPWRIAEARALAIRVGELIDGGAEPREVVLLTRATTDMRAYERALEQRGIPTYVIGGRGYWSHPQVVDLVAYLKALANPREEEALYTVLASPLVGVSLDALVVLASTARASGRDPWWVLREPPPELSELDPDDRGRLSTFAEWFSVERPLAARAGIEDLIDRALQRSGYDLAMLAMPGGARRLANVRKLMRLGRDYEADGGCDLHGFLELVRDREAGRSADSRESEAPVEGEALNAVRLMTIHRAKGLEFEIVCVADLGRVAWRPNDLLRVTRDGRIGLRLARPGTGGREPALAFKEIGQEQQDAEQSEERRLFYVAMTRARERLILSGAARLERFHGNRSPGSEPMAWIAPAFVPDLAARIVDGGAGGVLEREGTRLKLAFPAPEELAVSGVTRAPDVPDLPDAPGAPGAPVVLGHTEAPAPVPAAAPGPPVSSLSYSSLGEYERCGYRFYVERVLGLPPAPMPRGGAGAHGSEGSGVRAANERGVLVHALLERLDFRRPVTPSPAAIAAAATRSKLAPPSSDAETQDLIELVRRFADSELCVRLGQATEARREERFSFLLENGVLLTGALDVLAREKGGRALVVDYKSDRLDGGDPTDAVGRAYRTQRLVYALAALRSGAQAVEIAHCFLERPDEPVSVAYARADGAELERELVTLSAGVMRREFAVAEQPHRALCAGCPAEGGLCSWPLELTRREGPDRLF
jgi:ATP-dependent helicase/nuclease subunit A